MEDNDKTRAIKAEAHGKAGGTFEPTITEEMLNEACRVYFEGGSPPSDPTTRMLWLLMEALHETADHHRAWWVEQAIQELLPPRRVYEALYGKDERTWPRGVAP